MLALSALAVALLVLLMRQLARLPGVKIVAFADIYQPHAKKAQEIAGGCPWYRDYRKMLQQIELFQRHGINVTRHHFYNPIPDTRVLAADDGDPSTMAEIHSLKILWDNPVRMYGLEV